MTTLRKAAQQALEALLDDCLVQVGPHSWERRSDLAIAALRAALAEPVQEPMAKVVSTAPERIWLDLGFDPADEDIAFDQLFEATWSQDNATGWGIEYVRADLAAQPQHTAVQEPVQESVKLPTTAAQQALEAMEEIADEVFSPYDNKLGDAILALRAALAEPVQEPVAGRAFLERILAAMEGVIDVADRKTDEFDALRSCVIDLTLMLHTAQPQPLNLNDPAVQKRLAAQWGYVKAEPLTDKEIWRTYKNLWIFHPAEEPRLAGDVLKFARAIERAHGIGA